TAFVFRVQFFGRRFMPGRPGGTCGGIGVARCCSAGSRWCVRIASISHGGKASWNSRARGSGNLRGRFWKKGGIAAVDAAYRRAGATSEARAPREKPHRLPKSLPVDDAIQIARKGKRGGHGDARR